MASLQSRLSDLITAIGTDIKALQAAQVFNVKTYGATGDGSTEDTTAINDAITDLIAEGGGRLYFPEGTYMVSPPLLIPSNCIVEGEGRGISIIKTIGKSYTGNAKGSTFLNVNWEAWSVDPDLIVDWNIHVRDLTIDGNSAGVGGGSANEQEGIDWCGVRDFTIVNVEVKNAVHDSIDLNMIIRGVISDCYIHDGGWDGIHCDANVSTPSSDLIAVRNVVYNCAHQRQIYGDGQHAGIHNSSSRGITAFNVINTCWRGILVAGMSECLVMGNIIAATQSDFDIEVNATATQVIGNICEASSVSSGNIQVAGTGNGIIVQGNNLNHNTQTIKITCNKPVIILANQCMGGPYLYSIELQNAAHIVTNNYINNRPSNTARGAIHVASTAIGSHIQNNRVAGTGAGRAILSAANDVIIQNNSIVGTPTTAIQIQADYNLVTGNRISDASTVAILIDATAEATYLNDNDCDGSTLALTNNGTNTRVGTDRRHRVVTVTSTATLTPSANANQFNVTAQTVALAIANPSGMLDGQSIMFRIKDNGTVRDISWDTYYRAVGVTLPNTTVAGKTTYIGAKWNATDGKVDVIAIAQEA